MFNTVPPHSASRETFRLEALSSGPLIEAKTGRIIHQPAAKTDDGGFWEAVGDELDKPTLPPIVWELVYFSLSFIAGLIVTYAFWATMMMAAVLFGGLYTMLHGSDAPQQQRK